MTSTQVEVITSVQRRRRWSRAEKERIVSTSLEPGAAASAVAREAGIHVSQLFRWRRQLCEVSGAAPGFAAVTVAAEPCSPAAPAAGGTIEVELPTARVRIIGLVDPGTVSTVIEALRRRP